MNPVIFQVNGPLPDSKYLLGGYRWSSAMRLTSALLTCRPPAAGGLTLTLEIGGNLMNTVFTIGPGSQSEITQRQDLTVQNIVVPANSRVRWKAVFTDAAENAAASASITLFLAPDNGAIIKPALSVAWVLGDGGAERLTLFSYNPLTHTFIPLAGASGRAAITNPGAELSISIQDRLALLVSSSTLYVNELQATGATATSESPRLEFQIDGQRVAALTKSGVLLVSQVAQETPPALSPTEPEFYRRFAFYSGGVLTAILSTNGLTMLGLEEPLPL